MMEPNVSKHRGLRGWGLAFLIAALLSFVPLSATNAIRGFIRCESCRR